VLLLACNLERKNVNFASDRFLLYFPALSESPDLYSTDVSPLRFDQSRVAAGATSFKGHVLRDLEGRPIDRRSEKPALSAQAAALLEHAIATVKQQHP
jgi:hypothetical protein